MINLLEDETDDVAPSATAGSSFVIDVSSMPDTAETRKPGALHTARAGSISTSLLFTQPSAPLSPVLRAPPAPAEKRVSRGEKAMSFGKSVGRNSAAFLSCCWCCICCVGCRSLQMNLRALLCLAAVESLLVLLSGGEIILSAYLTKTSLSRGVYFPGLNMLFIVLMLWVFLPSAIKREVRLDAAQLELSRPSP